MISNGQTARSESSQSTGQEVLDRQSSVCFAVQSRLEHRNHCRSILYVRLRDAIAGCSDFAEASHAKAADICLAFHMQAERAGLLGQRLEDGSPLGRNQAQPFRFTSAVPGGASAKPRQTSSPTLPTHGINQCVLQSVVSVCSDRNCSPKKSRRYDG